MRQHKPSRRMRYLKAGYTPENAIFEKWWKQHSTKKKKRFEGYNKRRGIVESNGRPGLEGTQHTKENCWHSVRYKRIFSIQIPQWNIEQYKSFSYFRCRYEENWQFFFCFFYESVHMPNFSRNISKCLCKY